MKEPQLSDGGSLPLSTGLRTRLFFHPATRCLPIRRRVGVGSALFAFPPALPAAEKGLPQGVIRLDAAREGWDFGYGSPVTSAFRAWLVTV